MTPQTSKDALFSTHALPKNEGWEHTIVQQCLTMTGGELSIAKNPSHQMRTRAHSGMIITKPRQNTAKRNCHGICGHEVQPP